jgi:hypothetical protein
MCGNAARSVHVGAVRSADDDDLSGGDQVSLARLGDVPADYKHYAKAAIPLPGGDLVTEDAHLKWYEIREPHRTVPDDWREQAREFLRSQAGSGELPISGDLGFVLHHLCGESFYFLIVWTWRNANELWETVYAADAANDEPYRPLELKHHKEVACVWELGVVLHERQAWSAFLYTDRDEQAKRTYLADRYEGVC